MRFSWSGVSATVVVELINGFIYIYFKLIGPLEPARRSFCDTKDNLVFLFSAKFQCKLHESSVFSRKAEWLPSHHQRIFPCICSIRLGTIKIDLVILLKPFSTYQ